MHWIRVGRQWSSGRPSTSYRQVYDGYRLDDVEAQLVGRLATGVNACVECCDRWASDRMALDWHSQAGGRQTRTFAQLRDESARFASLLRSAGVRRGDVVACMLPRVPELLTVALGTWRAGAVYQPLFTAFGPRAIADRLRLSGAKLLVTDALNRAKVELAQPPPVLLADELDARLAQHSADFAPVPLDGDAPFLLMSTSGSTGPAKGVRVPLRALLPFRDYMTHGVQLLPSDRYWNMADPGWAYGLYYAVVGPLLLGHATTFYDGSFTADSACRLIAHHGITNLAGAPTAYRLLIAAGDRIAATLRDRLRVVSSAGEPLNPDVVHWFDQHVRAPIHDHYGQTELGMVVNNHHGLDHPVQVGSAGLAMPGWRVAVLDQYNSEINDHRVGTLAVDIERSPAMWFTGYLDQPPLSGRYYLTGDSVRLEPSGHVSFVGRNDDVITSAGYRIGPFEIESALVEHPAVAEAAVVGKPDAQRTEIVKAFVVLRHGCQPSEQLVDELRRHVRSRLSAHAYPRQIAFVDQLPKTPSGKIQRYLLRQRDD